MTDRLPLAQHTDDTITELYERLDQLRVMYNAASEREHDLINERDQLREERTAARQLHQPGKDWSWKEFGCTHDGAHAAFCVTCRQCHPCPTVRALDTALAGPAQPPAAAQAESHSCGNCAGIDPDTCLMSPNSPPEQCPAAQADTEGSAR